MCMPSSKQASKERTNQPTNQATNEKTNPGTNQPASQPANQPTNKLDWGCYFLFLFLTLKRSCQSFTIVEQLSPHLPNIANFKACFLEYLCSYLSLLHIVKNQVVSYFKCVFKYLAISMTIILSLFLVNITLQVSSHFYIYVHLS